MPGPEPPPSAESALERVIARYRSAIERVARRHSLQAADVDDVLQQVRIRLWKALDSDEKIAGVAASYVYRAATTAALDLIRRRRAHPGESIDDEEGGAPLLIARDATADTFDRRELAGAIASSVAELAPGRRQVVRMYLAGYAAEEVRALLGWSEAKARNLLYRGLADLRVKLTARGIHPGVAS